MSIAASIGRTPLVELTTVVPSGCGRVFAKVEGQNPSGSMKDRMACSVIRGALESGRLSWKAMERSVVRLRALKDRYLLPWRDPDPREARRAAGTGESAALAEEIASRSGLTA